MLHFVISLGIFQWRFFISQWATTKWTEDMEALAREKYVPMVMALGAECVDVVRTGDLSFLVITKHTDAKTAEAAQTKIDAILNEAADEPPMTMSNVERGSAFASG